MMQIFGGDDDRDLCFDPSSREIFSSTPRMMLFFSFFLRVPVFQNRRHKCAHVFLSFFLSLSLFPSLLSAGSKTKTGIAVAMVCAQRGYPCVICMAEPFSVERRKIMRMLGAKVIVTPKGGKGTGMVKKAEELAEKHGWFLTSQFENEANWKFHEKTTGQEILRDFNGKNLTHFVTGYGTGGTFHGVSKALKANRPEVKICLLEPSAAPLLASGTKTERKPSGAPVASHPAFTPHPVQGWTPDFIPLVLESGIDMKDELIPIDGPDAMQCAKDLASKEGIFTGISGGATFSGALKVAKSAPKGSSILCMLPDTSERYMSTPLYDQIQADMDESELEIAKSTPSFQLIPGQEPILQA